MPLLLDAHADTSLMTIHGHTALDAAIKFEHFACSELLMSHIGEAVLKRDATVALRAALAAGTLQALRDATGLHGAAACAAFYQEACEARDRLEEARLAEATERKQAKKRRQKQAKADTAAAADEAKAGVEEVDCE